MKTVFPIHKFRELPTPFYYYDTKVLRDTLACVNRVDLPKSNHRHLSPDNL